MPLQPFKFLQVTGDDVQAKNWRILDDGSKTVQFTPTITNFTLAPATKIGHYSIYGPIVFYHIMLDNTINAVRFKWNINATITMPIMPVLKATGQLYMPQCMPPPIDGDSGNPLTTEWPLIKWVSGLPYLFFNNAAATDALVMSIHGWYYRN